MRNVTVAMSCSSPPQSQEGHAEQQWRAAEAGQPGGSAPGCGAGAPPRRRPLPRAARLLPHAAGVVRGVRLRRVGGRPAGAITSSWRSPPAAALAPRCTAGNASHCRGGAPHHDSDPMCMPQR